MEVEDEMEQHPTANSDGSEQDMDDHESSFEVLLKHVKVLEKQSKSHREQLASKLEQERLKWQQERQELLDQLRQKQSPSKAPKSPSRPVLGALSPNKQHGPASKASQATSTSSFQDIFISPVKKSLNATSSTLQPVSPSKTAHAFKSPNRLEAELQAVKKELKRVNYKYQALYDAQEEILQKRNQDRDKWRHFKNVVKMATAKRPEFQLELRKADAILKKQAEETATACSAAKDSHKPTAPGGDTSLTVVPSPSAAPIGHSVSTLGPVAPSNLHTSTQHHQAFRSRQPTSIPAQVSRTDPQSPSPSKPPSTCANWEWCSGQGASNRTHEPLFTPVPGESAYRPRAHVILEFPRLFIYEKHDQNTAKTIMLRADKRLDDDYLDWAASAALQDILEDNEATLEAEISALQEWEYDNDVDTVHRICDYEDPYSYMQGISEDRFPAGWQLDGRRVILPPGDFGETFPGQVQYRKWWSTPLYSSTQANVEDWEHRTMSQIEDCYHMLFWSQFSHNGSDSSIVESIPTDIEFGSYQPDSQDPVVAKPIEVTESPSPKQSEMALLIPRVITMTELWRLLGLTSDEDTTQTSNSGVPNLFPLPQDLQSTVPPGQDILEESQPVRRLKRPRVSTLFGRPASAPIDGKQEEEEEEEEEKEKEQRIWKPFESRGRRSLGSPVASSSVSSQNSQPSSNQGPVIAKLEDEAHTHGIQPSIDNETTEASSSPDLKQEYAAVPAEARTTSCSDEAKTTFNATAGVATSISQNESVSGAVLPPHPDYSPQASTAMTGRSEPPSESAQVEPSDGKSDEVDKDNDSIAEDMHLLTARQLPSYRPSVLSDNFKAQLPKKLSDEKIGPRRSTLSVTTAEKLSALPSAPQDFCETYLAKFTGKVASTSKQTRAPLGKPITGAAQLGQSPRGTPTAWHNMSSKRRISSTTSISGTPSTVVGSRSSKSALLGPRVASATMNISASSAQDMQPESSSSKHAICDVLSSNRLPPRQHDLPSVNSQPAKSAPSRPTALEVATGVKRSKPKKPRKSGQLPDDEVMCDLEVVASAILQKSTFTLASKRSAAVSALPEDKPPKKPRKSLDEVEEKRSTSSDNTANTLQAFASKRTLAERKWLREMSLVNGQLADTGDKDGLEDGESSRYSSKASTSKQAGEDVKVKAEPAYDEMSTEESEEYEGQHFMRKLHQQRNKAMQADPLKHKGRGAYARQVPSARDIPGESRRPDVAYKETIRGREARAAIHGVDCPCCSGYYEYKTRNLPLEERAKAAAEMVNDVSRHRQNWENAESPPGYWQMGFPSTLEVERLNEEAAVMKREKQEKEQREQSKDTANNCEGRRTYKMV